MLRIDIARMLILSVLTAACGCHAWQQAAHDAPPQLALPTIPDCAPRELSKVRLPSYRIEPPDIIDIEAVRLVPRSPYELSTLDQIRVRVQRTQLARLARSDVLVIRVPGAPSSAPIDGNFLIQPNGLVNLGTPYGSVELAGLTLEEAEQAIEAHVDQHLVASEATVAIAEAGTPVDADYAIEIDGFVDFGHPYGRAKVANMTIKDARERLVEHFARFFDEPDVSLGLLQGALQQQIVGEHLVAPDGTVSLGMYGSVSVVSLTLDQARRAIEARLSETLDRPKVSVSIFSYNSKVFYLITEGAGLGDNVFRFPITGNDTVLDAISQINGLSEISSSKMWIARPTPTPGEYQIMPIDWRKVTSLGDTETNYQLLPGDRLYVAEDSLVALDTSIAKLTRPLERIMGFSILGVETVTRFSGQVLRGGGNPRGFR